MRVFFLTGSLNQGGAEYQILALAELFQRKGHEVTVLALTDYDFYKSWVEEKNLSYSCFSNEQNKLIRSFKAISAIKRFSPDLVISYTRVVSKVAMFAKLFGRIKAPFLVSERTSLVLPKQDFRYFNILRFANIITTNSFSKLDYVKNRFPFLKQRIYFMPNILNPKKFGNKARTGWQGDARMFCYVGRLSEEKNVLGLIKAFQIANQSNQNWQLNIYGEARNPSYLKKIEEYIAVHRLSSQISLCGPSSDIGSVYAKHDCLCLTSFFEGFSNVLSEGLSNGMILLASDIKENHFLVEEGKNGFLANPKNPKNIAQAILRILDLKEEEFLSFSSTN